MRMLKRLRSYLSKRKASIESCPKCCDDIGSTGGCTTCEDWRRYTAFMAKQKEEELENLIREW
jgi:recombinational DNA repair protein RecR